MNASTTATPTDSTLGLLRGLLLIEAAALLTATIFLSLLAGGTEELRGPGSGETAIRFAAGGTFLAAILAAVASRGVRRRKGWGWTLGALLQVLVAIGTGIAILVAEWHPALLVGFALPTIVMLVLSTNTVRRALGQS